MEKETNKFLPFLDVLVKNKGRSFIYYFSLWEEIISIGLFMQYNKLALFGIKSLIHRAFKIRISCIVFHNKINKIKNILQKNMYPW